MKRIVIFGNSGSGKSTLAQTLAEQEKLAHLDLDTLAWDPDQPITRRPAEDSIREISAFLERNDGWVIEGCYSSLLQPVIDRSTELIFLNPGMDTCVANCRSRPWEPHKYPSVEAQNENLEMLLGWVREYETRDDEFSLRAHRQLFDRFQGFKTEYLSNEREQ